MSLYLNRTEIIGCLGQDVEGKQSVGGKDYASFSVATKRYMGKDQEPGTMWHNVTCFGQNATFLSGRAKKGMWIMVIGEYVKETYQKENEEKTGFEERTSFKLLASDVKLIGRLEKSGEPGQTSAPTGRPVAVPAGNVGDEDIPF